MFLLTAFSFHLPLLKNLAALPPILPDIDPAEKTATLNTQTIKINFCVIYRNVKIIISGHNI